jgi:hypothetical protein
MIVELYEIFAVAIFIECIHEIVHEDLVIASHFEIMRGPQRDVVLVNTCGHSIMCAI